ncbi:MAG: PQQ-dependent sugar dehydrogenase [Trueperaceae bacterium]|nr:PQQ-dependent sugar dehydrogenase [Trueperaceae bacterium]
MQFLARFKKQFLTQTFVLAQACALVVLIACLPTVRAQNVSLETYVSGVQFPVVITHAGDGSERLFVVQQTGQIRIVQNGEVFAQPFLDISDRTRRDGERGLLGLAFHPDYTDNGLLYVNYTRASNGSTVIAEFSVTNDPNRADPASERVLLDIAQPYANHNGGQLAFGPDGYLYIGTGDGGAAGDPRENGQDPTTLLGALLRIDVSNGDPYAVPNDNPFVGDANRRDEIWAYGLRNPWRFSFDRDTGDLFIADVGQNAWEEVNFQAASSDGGENYGWNIMEASHCFEPRDNCDESGLIIPIMEYSHSVGRSITGGYRYRGADVRALQGHYVFGDFVTGIIWAAQPQDNGSWGSVELLRPGFNVVTFGEDETGELYVANYGGTIYRFVSAD